MSSNIKRIDQYNFQIPLNHPSVLAAVTTAASKEPQFKNLVARYHPDVGTLLVDPGTTDAQIDEVADRHLAYLAKGAAPIFEMSHYQMAQSNDGRAFRFEPIDVVHPSFRLTVVEGGETDYIYGFCVQDVSRLSHLVLTGIPKTSLLTFKCDWTRAVDRGYILASRSSLIRTEGLGIPLPLKPKPTPPTSGDCILLPLYGGLQEMLALAQLGLTERDQFPTLDDGTGFRVRHGHLENESLEEPGVWKRVAWRE